MIAPAIGDVIVGPGASLFMYLIRCGWFVVDDERLFTPGVECGVSGDNNVECGRLSIIFSALLSCMFAVARAMFFHKKIKSFIYL